MRTSDFILKKMQAFYDFIAEHPECTMIDICAHFCSPASSIRHYLSRMVDGKHISFTETKRGQSTGSKKLYSAVQGKRPLVALPRRKGRPITAKIEQPRAIPECKRIIKKATQIGMAPYADLPADFFARPPA